MIYDWFTEFAKEVRVNVLAYDYEGFGKANGFPSEKSCYEDIVAAYRFLVEVLGTPSEQIVLYGRSLGSGPSCYLAEKLFREGETIGGMILQASFSLLYLLSLLLLPSQCPSLRVSSASLVSFTEPIALRIPRSFQFPLHNAF